MPKPRNPTKEARRTTAAVQLSAPSRHRFAPKAACFPILTDPAHWGDGAWTVASTESSRYYLATIGPVSNRHLLVVALVALANPAAERLRFEKAVAPILDSLDVSRVTFN